MKSYALAFALVLLLAFPVLSGETSTEEPGVVTAINPKTHKVIVSLGSDNEMEQGLVIEIFRGDRILGSARVVKIISNVKCEADIIYGADKIQRGDRIVLSDGKLPRGVKYEAPGAGERKERDVMDLLRDLSDRLADIEKRLSELEEKVAKLPKSDKTTAPSREEGDEGLFDETLDEMSKKKDDASEEETEKKAEPEKTSPPAEEDQGFLDENSEDVPYIEGKVLGAYDEGKAIGVSLPKGHKAKHGYFLYVFKRKGGEIVKVAKIRITDVRGEVVGGPIIMRYRKPGSKEFEEISGMMFASTRLPEK